MRRWNTRGTMGAAMGVVIVAVLALGMLTVAGGAMAATPPLTFGQVAVNQTTKFSGNGFEANEPLAFWVTAPDRTVTPLAGDQADAAGAFAITVSFSTDGFWQVTAHGTSTKKEIIGGFTVGNLTTTAAATVVLASATAIAPSQSVTFSRDGFRPLEPVSLWATGPDGKVTPLDGTSAEISGAVNVPVTFPTSGFWQVTAHGTISGKEAIVGYSVNDALAVVSNATVTVTPVPTTANVAAFPTSTPAASAASAFATAPGGSEARPTSRTITGTTAVLTSR